MRKAIVIAAIAAASCGVAWAQPPTEELGAALAMERWTFWMMVTGAITAVLTTGSVLALVWTFLEQRKLTQTQERAVLEYSVVSATYWLATTELSVSVTVQNTGRTHAEFLGASVVGIADELSFDDFRADDGEVRPPKDLLRITEARKHAFYAFSRRREMIPPGKTVHLRFEAQAMTDDRFAASQDVPTYGAVHYRDIYGRKHKLHIFTSVVANLA